MRNHEKRSEMFKYGSTSNRNSAGSSTLKRLNGGAGTFTFGVGPQVNSSTIARNRTDCSSSGTSRSSTGSGSSVILTNRFGSEQSSTRPVSSNGVQLDTSLTTINGVTNGLLHDLWPKAIFNCEKESHPFITREVMIKDIVKIGRAIVGSKVSLDTCLFDSRVLSRNHAILTYKDNKFLLRDTKSSNGTYLNGVRLSNPGEESSEYEIFSGDLIKFGVDIVEDSGGPSSFGKGNVCPPVIATVTLFHPDGSQALRKPWQRYGFDHKSMNVSSEQLLCLAYHVELAQKRQVQLQTKLRLLEVQLGTAEGSVQHSWQSLVTEDMLLSKVESLQTRLQSVLLSSNSNLGKSGKSRVSSKDKENETIQLLRENLLEVQNQKEDYEEKAKKTIQSLYDQRLEHQERISKAESRLITAENECKRLKTLIDELQIAIDRSNERVCDQEQQLEECKKKQSETSDKLLQANLDKMNLEQKLIECQSREAQLTEQLQELNVELEVKQLQLDVFFQALPKEGSVFDSLMKDSQDETKLEGQLATLTVASVSSRSPSDSCTSHLSELELIKNSVESVQKSKCDLEKKLNSIQSEQSELARKCELLEMENKILKKECTNMQITSAKREQEIAQRSTEKDKIVCDLTTQNDCLNEKVTHLQSNIFRKQEHICHLERDREQSLKTLNTLSATVRKFEQQLELARVELNVFKGQLNDRERTLSATEDLVKRQNERLMKLEHVEQDLKVELVVRDLVNDLIDRIEEEDPKKCIDTINASSNESGNNQQMKTHSEMESELEKIRRENRSLQEDLAQLNGQFDQLSYHNKVAFLFAVFPICVLFASVVIAYLPLVSFLTGTKEP